MSMPREGSGSGAGAAAAAVAVAAEGEADGAVEEAAAGALPPAPSPPPREVSFIVRLLLIRQVICDVMTARRGMRSFGSRLLAVGGRAAEESEGCFLHFGNLKQRERGEVRD